MDFPPFFDLSGLDISLDLRWMKGVSPKGVDTAALAERIEAALDEMEALEAGALANPDEGRRVGHYWLRAPDLAPEPELRDAITAVRERARDFAQDLGGRASEVLVIGIGGSALGPQLVSDALGGPHDRRKVRFLDNTDPDGANRLLDRVDLARTLVVVISKSGRTPETRNGFLRVKAAYDDAGLTFAEHAVAVTGEGSELDARAANEGWLARFPMWDWVGGRTSVTSAVGLVPAQLQGLDVARLLSGAGVMDRATRSRSLADNPALAMATMWLLEAEHHGRRAMVVLPYKDRLILLSKYLQQLVMESLGKRLDRHGQVVHQGLTVYGNKGSTDQHAYVQQLREGPADFFATFIEVLEDGPDIEVDAGVTCGDYLSGFLAGTRQALFDAGRRSMTLTVERVDARRLGALIALFERAVGLFASLVDINAYHQPGVEAGKVAAAKVLELQARLLAKLAAGESGSAEHLARLVGGSAQDALHLLRHLAANGRVAASGRGLAMEFRARDE